MRLSYCHYAGSRFLPLPEHRHQTIRAALECDQAVNKPNIFVHSESSEQKPRTVSSDEIIVMGLTEKDPKAHGLNCILSPLSHYRQKIKPANLKYLEERKAISWTHIRNDRASIQEWHLFLTLPMNFKHPDSLRRILPIDLAQEYQNTMSHLLESYRQHKEELLNHYKPTQPIGWKVNLVQEIQEAFAIPSYSVSRPGPRQLWRPAPPELTKPRREPTSQPAGRK